MYLDKLRQPQEILYEKKPSHECWFRHHGRLSGSEMRINWWYTVNHCHLMPMHEEENPKLVFQRKGKWEVQLWKAGSEVGCVSFVIIVPAQKLVCARQFGKWAKNMMRIMSTMMNMNMMITLKWRRSHLCKKRKRNKKLEECKELESNHGNCETRKQFWGKIKKQNHLDISIAFKCFIDKMHFLYSFHGVQNSF